MHIKIVFFIFVYILASVTATPWLSMEDLVRKVEGMGFQVSNAGINFTNVVQDAGTIEEK